MINEKNTKKYIIEMQRTETVFVRDHCVSIVNYYYYYCHSIGEKRSEWREDLEMNLLKRLNESRKQILSKTRKYQQYDSIIISGVNGWITLSPESKQPSINQKCLNNFGERMFMNI